MANPEQSPAHRPNRDGALTHTARIAGGVIAESRRLGDLAAAESERLAQAVDALRSTLGGGPPAEITEAIRRAQTASARIEQARAALHESAEALGVFLNRRI